MSQNRVFKDGDISCQLLRSLRFFSIGGAGFLFAFWHFHFMKGRGDSMVFNTLSKSTLKNVRFVSMGEGQENRREALNSSLFPRGH
jgi:hypothetical protein